MSTSKERIRHIFTALGLTQSQFASQYGINRQTMYSIASGRNEPSLKLLMQLCDVEPRISAEYLLKGTGSPLIEIEELANPEPPTVDSLRLQNDILKKQLQVLEAQINRLTDQNEKLFDYMMSTKKGFERVG